jgi:hypothetical protein
MVVRVDEVILVPNYPAVSIRLFSRRGGGSWVRVLAVEFLGRLLGLRYKRQV